MRLVHIGICGQLGAGCTEVGEILSKKLGMKCVNSSNIVKRLMLTFGESFEGFEQHIRSGEVNLDRMIDGELDEMLMEEELIVEGRSAFMLFNNKNTFLVSLIAPERLRAEHVARRRDILVEEALEVVRESDEERKNMVKRLFKKEWLNSDNYSLIINMDSRSYEETADLLFNVIKK